ncbi:DNA-binding protein [Halarchaeum grantii]|uniref:DNA-binding protein n=1 Tax=Halarchaeum grantii TaxID=1193105 RepID=A0A830FCW9_9EURY|nr:DNA-binding protein [Halarchaeum grantii]GGL34301.1 DNA-binding protein [Halarchaeum grantii]
MSSKTTIGDEVSVEERVNEEFDVVDDVAERERNLRPTVSMEIVARIDVKEDPYAGLTLEAEERVRAREWEIERTRSRYDRRQDSDREARTRDYVAERTPSRTWQAWTSDPRGELSRDELAVVNQQAQRLAGQERGYSRSAISRMVGERVRRGQDIVDAVLETSEALRYGPGQIVPIGALERFEADDEVSVEGVVVRLFEPRHPAIAQVGLLEDETGRTKLTVWERSNQPAVRLGERVRVRGGALGFYRERACIAATGWSELVFPERGRWWER